jgi:hypothetical protein
LWLVMSSRRNGGFDYSPVPGSCREAGIFRILQARACRRVRIQLQVGNIATSGSQFVLSGYVEGGAVVGHLSTDCRLGIAIRTRSTVDSPPYRHATAWSEMTSVVRGLQYSRSTLKTCNPDSSRGGSRRPVNPSSTIAGRVASLRS